MTILRRGTKRTGNRPVKNSRTPTGAEARTNHRAGGRVSLNRRSKENRKRVPQAEEPPQKANRKISPAKRAEKAGIRNSDEEPPNETIAPPREPRLQKIVPVVYAVLRFIAVLLAIAAVAWGGKLLYSYATTSSHFAIEHVEIKGNVRLSNQEVLTAAGFEIGNNIFSVNLAQVEHHLKEQPWVVDAKVRQQLPKTIIINIVERTPEILVLFDVPYLVDETGDIFKRWSTDDPLPDCVITGISKRELIEDAEGTQKIVLDSISLKERYHMAGNDRYAKLYEIHHEIDGGFSLSVGDDPFYVKLGKPPYRTKLTRLAQLLRKIGKEGQKPQIVYFDNEKRPDRVTVKMKP